MQTIEILSPDEQVEIPMAGRAKEWVLVADAFKINDDKTMGEAADLARQMKAALDDIEAQRDSLVRPLFTAEREYNKQFGIVTDPLKKAGDHIRALIKNFDRERMQKHREAWEKQKEEHVKVAAEASENDQPEPVPPPPTPKPGLVRGAYGSKAVIKEKWIHELEDIASVPLKYLTVDAAAVKAAIKDGVREIPGLKIYDDGQVAIS